MSAPSRSVSDGALEEGVDLGLSFDWGVTADGRGVRVATIAGRPVRFVIVQVEHRIDVARAVDSAVAGPLNADEVSELSSWRREGSTSVRHIDSLGLQTSFLGVDEDAEIAVDAAIDAVLAAVQDPSVGDNR